MNTSTIHRYASDFETVVTGQGKEQEETSVWSCAISEVGNDNPDYVEVGGSMEWFINWCADHKWNQCHYFHNLKFDGSFILDWLLRSGKWKQAKTGTIEDNNFRFIEKPTEMNPYTYKYSISSMGQWYGMTLRFPKHYVEIRDSLKLLPFSVNEIGKSFKTKHQKLEMEYVGERYPDCPISEEEMGYIKNDVLVMSEALQICIDRGMTKMTIGSCCMNEYRKQVKNGRIEALSAFDYHEAFPDLKQFELDEKVYGSSDADEYIRKSYFGGWCYVKRGCEGIVFENGETYDVNSLYPSMMSSESGNKYPIGLPRFWSGSQIPDWAKKEDSYYFVRFRCNFWIKPKHLPFIQIKNSWLYKSNEMLETNLLYDSDAGKWCNYYKLGGAEYETKVTMTMTMTDYERFLRHYDNDGIEVVDGCAFMAAVGIFDEYIEKYKKQKLETTGAEKQEAKLFLNNLYGKLASSDNSSYKVARLHEGRVVFDTVVEHEKDTVYIPCGSAITSYARDFTIRNAQENYDIFLYADTDSIHCTGKAKGLVIHPNNFNAWKNEASWDKGIFVRQKTYIERVTCEDGDKVEKPWWNIKCAGMTKRPKELLAMNLDLATEGWKNDEEREFVQKPLHLTDYRKGITIPSNLKPRRIKGGVLLVEQDYVMR